MKKMKTKTLLTFALLSSMLSFGQDFGLDATAKGNFLLSAGINFNLLPDVSASNNSLQGDEISSFSFALTPKIGYFFTDKLALGAVVITEFGQTGDEALFDNSPVERTNTSISIGPFARYYLDSGFFGEASFGFGSTNLGTNDTTGNQSPIFQYSLGIGYAFFINKSISIEPLAQYNYINVSNRNVDFNLITTGIFVGVGFSAYL